MLIDIIRSSLTYLKRNKYLLYVIIPAFILYMGIIMPSGTDFCYHGTCGYQFWGVHDHDGLWNLAIAQVSFLHFPPVVPTFTGATLRGYNFLLDLLIYIVKVTLHIHPFITYFKLIPLLWYTVQVACLIALSRVFKSDKSYVTLFLIIAFLACPFSALLSIS